MKCAALLIGLCLTVSAIGQSQTILSAPFICEWANTPGGCPNGNYLQSANCGPASALIIADKYSGATPIASDLDQMDAWLQENYSSAGYSANPPFGSGTTTTELAALASQYFNLPNSASFANWTVSQLQQELQNGYPVLVYVETWMMTHKQYYGHYMVLLGLDSQNVYVNDPGRQNGAGVAYPISNFNAAWLVNNNSGVSIHPNPSANPIPTISSLQPPSGTVSSAAITLTINGTGFLPTSTVTFNNVSHTPSFVNSGQTTIQLSTSDLATAGVFGVVVTNPPPGGGTSNTVGFAVNNPIPSISSLQPPSLPVGSAASTLTINGMGFLPASTATFNGASHVASFVNPGQLTIQLTTVELASAGTFPVVVTNPPPGGGSSTSASFTVATASQVSVSISPTTVTLAPQQTQSYTATVNGSTNTSVFWTILEGVTGGTITGTGLYTAPNQSGIFHVIATSQADTSQSALATVTVNNCGSAFITFRSDRNSGQFDIFLYDLDPSTRAMLPLPGLNNPAAFEELGSLSADGCLIAFDSNRGGSTDILLYDRRTSALVPLPGLNDPNAEDVNPVLSADGQSVLFRSNRNNNQFDVFLYDRQEVSFVTLPGLNDAAAYEKDYQMTPDGKLIVFASDRIGGQFDVFLYDVGAKTLISLPGLNDAQADDDQPSIDASGRFIAFRSSRGFFQSSILIYDRDSATLIDPPGVNGIFASNNFPWLSADGNWLVFDSTRNGSRDVFLYNRANGSFVDLPGLNDPSAEDSFARIVRP